MREVADLTFEDAMHELETIVRQLEAGRVGLRNVATKTERSHTDLIAEALDDLAEKYGEQAQEPGGKKSSPRGPRPFE